jgi:hypothetical protein
MDDSTCGAPDPKKRAWDLNWKYQHQANLRQGLKRAQLFRLPALDPALAPPSHISLKSVTTCAFAVGLPLD